eukprot:5886084-Prymnesium_polylepis.2
MDGCLALTAALLARNCLILLPTRDAVCDAGEAVAAAARPTGMQVCGGAVGLGTTLADASRCAPCSLIRPRSTTLAPAAVRHATRDHVR